MRKITLSSEAQILAATRQKDFREELKNSFNSFEVTTIQINENCLFTLDPTNRNCVYVTLDVDGGLIFGGFFSTKYIENRIIQQMRCAWRNKTVIFNFPLLPF